MGLTEILILAGAILGGYVSGLTGFGTGLTALPIWLLAVQPTIAGPIVVICSLTAQLLTLPAIWNSIEWKRITPFLFSAIIGVPIGTLLLGYIDSEASRLAIGILLVLYSSAMLLKKTKTLDMEGNRFTDAAVGFGGGIMGGVAGLCGVLPTIWIGLRKWGKDTKRGFFQGFNFIILCLSVISMLIAGYLTVEVGRLALIALPGTILGALLGQVTYNKMDDKNFNTAVLAVLLFSGFGIIIFRLLVSE